MLLRQTQLMIAIAFAIMPARGGSQQSPAAQNETQTKEAGAEPSAPQAPKAAPPKTAPAAVQQTEPPLPVVRAPSQAQYEASTRTRIDELNRRHRDLRKALKLLPAKNQPALRDSLRTAAGNRMVALLKLKQLASTTTEQWPILKIDVEKAVDDLAASIERSTLELEKVRK